MLVPVLEEPALTPVEAAAALKLLRQGITLGGIPVRELIEEGRR
jgi:hypothetical protein